MAGDEFFFNTLVCKYLLDDHFGLVLFILFLCEVLQAVVRDAFVLVVF